MKKQFLVLACLTLAACTHTTRLSPVAGTQPADYSFVYDENFPNGQPSQKTVIPNELDVRSCDISGWDFTAYTAQELADVLTFDSKTKFPPKNKLPKGFSPQKILKQNKNPGLGLRALHKQGITGKGIAVALIDQNLLLDHEQYTDRLRYYWQDPVYQKYANATSSMHGPAVTSILAGKTVGVAPQADIYYWAGKFENTDHSFNALPIAEALNRVLQYNYILPFEKRIRVVSISRGFNARDTGSAEFNQAVEKLDEHNIAVFTTNDVMTLSRTHSLLPADGTDYCRPAYWFETEEFPYYASMPDPLVPTDFRVTAAPNGVHDYVHYANGGLSWAVPYLTGLYALGVQMYPLLTKELFLQTLRQTATPQTCTYQGKEFTARYLVNPAAFIKQLQTLNATN